MDQLELLLLPRWLGGTIKIGFLDLAWTLEMPRRLFCVEEVLYQVLADQARGSSDDSSTIRLSRLSALHGSFATLLADLFCPPLPAALSRPEGGQGDLDALLLRLDALSAMTPAEVTPLLELVIHPHLIEVYSQLGGSNFGIVAANLSQTCRRIENEMQFLMEDVVGAAWEGERMLLEGYRGALSG